MLENSGSNQYRPQRPVEHVGLPSQRPSPDRDPQASPLWYSFAPPSCRRSAKMSSLTGQQKCQIHIMENVTLTQKEQARLQVLNSLLAENLTLDQAATLMGVTTRHTRRILAAPSSR